MNENERSIYHFDFLLRPPMHHPYLACLGFLVAVILIGADSVPTGPKATVKPALQPDISEN
ncbi:hypothetical protein PHMEG_00030764, partial [Phytophthora megakarya]